MPIRSHGTKRRYSSIDGWPSERRIASARILGRYFWPVRLFLTAFSSGQKTYCKTCIVVLAEAPYPPGGRRR